MRTFRSGIPELRAAADRLPSSTCSRRSVLAGLTALPFLRPGSGGAAPASRGGDLIGRLRVHISRHDEILLDVARRFDLGIVEVSAANPGIDPWVPGDERLVLLPSRHILPDAERRGIIINLAELRLYYVHPDGETIETHAIGIGRQGFETPLGHTRIVRKRKNPTWYPTESSRRENPRLPRVVGPGPANPLGTRALYLGWPTYLIHGTNKPYGVGRRVSHGCIRMYPEQVEALYEKVDIGTPVTVLSQSIKAGWQDGELYLEAHPDFDQLEELEATYRMTLKPPPPGAKEYVERKAGGEAARVNWQLVEAELVARRGYPVRVTGVPKAHPELEARAETTPPRARPLFDLY